VLKGVNAFYRVERGEEGLVVWLGMRVDLCHGEIKGASIDGVEIQEDLTVLMDRYGLSDPGAVLARLREDGRQTRICVLSRAMCDFLVECVDQAAEQRVTPEGGAAVTGVPDDMRIDRETGELVTTEEVQ
jgi:hypothetical protein